MRLVRSARAALLSRAAVGTAALQISLVELVRATATSTMTAEMDSSVGTATVPSSDQITMPGQIAATTLKFLTKARLCRVYKKKFTHWTGLDTLNATWTQTVHLHQAGNGMTRPRWNMGGAQSQKCQLK